METLYLEALEPAEIILPAPSFGHGKTFDYSFDCETWTAYDGQNPIALNAGDKIYVRSHDDSESWEYPYNPRFAINNGLIRAGGSVMSLFYSDPDADESTLPNDLRELFRDCTALTTAPALPATNLPAHAYSRMFMGCTALTTAPELPALTVPESAYLSMFQGCTALTTAPALPATSIGTFGYQGLFQDCTSLQGVITFGFDKVIDSLQGNYCLPSTSPGGRLVGPAGFGFYYTPDDAGSLPANWVVAIPHEKKHRLEDTGNHDYTALDNGYLTVKNHLLEVKYSPFIVGEIKAYIGANVYNNDGWFKCDGSAISRTRYPQLFALIGTTYGAGDGSTTFNLPDLRGKFLEGLPEGQTVGTSIAAGLPNITGQYNNTVATAAAGTLTTGGGTSYSGAISSISTTKGKYFTAAGTATTAYAYGCKFNASASNAIYGRATTVQPPAVLVHYIIFAGV